MMSDLGPGDPARGAAEAPARLRQGRRRGRRPLLQEAGHRDPHRRLRARPHAHADGPGRRSTSATARSSRSMRWSSRWAGAPCRTAWAWRAPVSRSTSGASSRSTSTADHRSRVSSRSATWSPHPPWPTSALPRGSWSSTRSWATTWSRSTTPRCRGASTAIPRWPLPGFRGAGQRGRLRRRHQEGPVRRQRPGPIIGEADGLVKVIAEKGPDGKAGRILGVHMVGPWVTEQLGQGYLSVNWEAHRGRRRPVHPAPPDAVGDLRRDGPGPDRKRPARWLTSPCPNWAKRSPRARSPSG